MATPGFIFGAPGLPATPQELSDKRKAAYAMISRALARAPKDAGEGLNAIGQALIARSMESEASDAQRAGLAQRQRADAGLAGLLGGAPAVPAAPGAAPTDAVTGSAGNFPASLITTESGGNWRAQNNVRGAGGLTGHFGRLQFGQARLQEAAAAGAIPPGTTPQQFMASPELQQRAEQWHFADIDNKIRANGLDRMIGQTINGVPITLDGMRAVAHLGGTGGLQRFIQSGGRYNPADANGTSLLNYLQRHGGGQRAQAPADQLTGGDGMEEPPVPITSDTFPLGNRPGLGVPADSPLESFGAALGPGMSGGPAPLSRIDPTAPNVPAAPSADGMMAGYQPVQAPQSAIPEITVGGTPQAPVAPPVTPPAPMQAPMPVARPNLEAPPQAQPAMSPTPMAPQRPAMSELERVMLLRDEQSLAPGEAQTLRGGLGGGNPVQMVAQALARPQTPAMAPQAPMQAAPAVPAPVASVASALGGQPVPQPQAAPAAGGSAQERVAAALRIVNDPWASDGTKAVAQQVIQQAMSPPQMQIVPRPDGTVLGINPRTGETRTLATGTRAPVQWQPIKDEAGNITGFYNPENPGDVRDARGQPVRAPQPAAPQAAAPVSAPPQTGSGAAPAQPATAPQPTPQTGPTGLPMNRTAFQRQQDERRQMAAANNIREGSDEFKFLMINGRLPTAGEKLTEQQSKDLIYHSRGAQALALLDGPTDPQNPQSQRLSDALTSTQGAIAARIPGGNFLQNEQYQRADQAGRNFLAAILRKDTGAAITAQEMDEYGRIFLPRPGDGPAVLQQKAEARKQAIDAIRAGLGPAEAKALGQDAIRAGVERATSGQRPPQSDPLASARDAIRRGAPREAVIERLKANGIDPAGL